MSVKSKHSASKKDKLGKKEKKKKLEESDDDVESSEEELDLTKECHPIGYYMNDRAEMINQMFSVIKGNKLKALLPPSLKEFDIDQLKLQCLDQLLGMSEKRITCILEGETLETSSESEVLESDECDSDGKNGSSNSSSSNRSDDSQEDMYMNDINSKHKKRKADSLSEGKGGKMAKTDSETAAPEQGKTLLEILELEMRARAIRALLKQSGNENAGDQADETKPKVTNKSDDKVVSGEVVDLTECEDEETPVTIRKEIPRKTDIDEKVSTFEEKIEKSKSEKGNAMCASEKSKRLQAELELRNKLFKKKIYRTRQQRMENEEEEKNIEKSDPENKESKSDINISNVVVKQEPVELTEPEVVVEDPEEGEISTSEDEYPVEIKQEVIEPETPEETNDVNDFVTKMDEDAVRVTAIDNGTFVSDSNLENMVTYTSQNENNEEKSITKSEVNKTTENIETKCQENAEVLAAPDENKEDIKESSEDKLDISVEETSWRDRWLQKGGVQKLVKSSKIFAKVKKRIAEKTQRIKEDGPTPYDANSDSNSNSRLEVIEGSIEEYERLSNETQGQLKGNEVSENIGATQRTLNEVRFSAEGNP